jgi:hypothetical protein
MISIRFRPGKRLTANWGLSITSVDGSIPQFDILQPLGTSQYKYQQPVASLSVDLGHKLAWNTGWNYYQYIIISTTRARLSGLRRRDIFTLTR